MPLAQNSTILDAAIKLAGDGFPVFPCKLTPEGEKRPLIAGWQRNASTDPDRVHSMFMYASATLIGVPAGEASGFVAIDVDPRHGGDKWLAERRDDLPQTRTHRTLNGGFHLLYRDDGRGIRNSANKLAPGVDVRGTGGFIVFPPSGGYSITDHSLMAEMPEWLATACLEANSKTATSRVTPWRSSAFAASNKGYSPIKISGARPWHKSTISYPSTPYGTAALDSACDEIRNCPDGAKHETINRASYSIGGLVSAGEIPEGIAFSELSAALASILHRCKDRCAAEKTLRRGFDEGKGVPREVPAMPEPEVVPESDLIFAPMLAKIREKDEALRRAAAEKRIAAPERVLQVDGLLKDLMEDCLSRAYRPQPFLALAAAISAVAAAAGRRYRTETGLRPNFYIIGCAPSGAGKDMPLDYVRRILSDAGMNRLVTGEEIASGSAIISALHESPVLIACLDEFGLMLQSMTGKKAAPYKAEMMAIIMKLYSRASSKYRGKDFADRKEKPRQDIEQPHFSIFGATTPGTLWAALESGALVDGSVARMLVFATDNGSVPRNRAVYNAPFDPQLIARLESVSAGAAGHDYGGDIASSMVSSVSMDAYVVKSTQSAIEKMDAYLDAQEEWQMRANDPDKTSTAGEGEIVARIGEHCAKLAMVAAISRNPAEPVIEEKDVEWASSLTNHCARTLLKQAGQHVADTDYEKKLRKAMEIISKHGPATESFLIRRGLKFPERERAEILRTLVASGVVEAVQTVPGTAGGRPAVKYALRITDLGE